MDGPVFAMTLPLIVLRPIIAFACAVSDSELLARGLRFVLVQKFVCDRKWIIKDRVISASQAVR